jgi:pyrroloquinoline quinone biosynthesis protein D
MTRIVATSVPRLRPGVRLRVLDDGTSALLVPEGVATLTPTGAAVVESIDGRRDVTAIVALMTERFEAAGADVERDVAELLERFAEHVWIEVVA